MISMPFSLFVAAGALALASTSNFPVVSEPAAVRTAIVGDAKDVVDTAVAAGSFQTLVAAVKAAGLVETLKGAGPFTVFAPSDEAFAKLPKETLESLLKPENKGMLTSILTYHVVPGKVMASAVTKIDFAQTVQGGALRIEASDAGVTIDGARVVKADIECANGVIHVIDRVVMPRTNLVETAKAASSFTTLLRAAVAAELAETLATGGPFTVFAPTDDAFAKLPKETLESLLKPESKGKLAEILKFHVVAGRVLAKDVVKMSAASTLLGREARIMTKDGAVMIGSAKVVKTDVLAGNGVIHVIDSVLIP